MQIVTDRGCDLSAEQSQDLPIHYAPMKLTLDGVTYSSGVDLQPDEFYDLFERSDGMPVTSQATVGDFAALYRQLAASDPEILSIHISSGLSGTMDSARAGAALVPEAKVTFFDTRTLACPEGWLVEAGARAVLAGWTVENILSMLEQMRQATMGMFTLDTLKYLINGGRISHMRGLMASLLHIRPAIGVDKTSGKYYTIGQELTFKKALQRMANTLMSIYGEGAELRLQLMHGKNPAGLEQFREILEGMFVCKWLPTVAVAPVLGAHTGGTLVGVAAGRADLFDIFKKI